MTEKPSVARDFAKALGVQGKGDGCIENNNYLITWAVGHLVELYEPHEYDKKWKTWSLDSLPISPASFRYKPISQTKKQFSIIRRILKDKKFDRIVVATDAGREGEVIARTIFLTCGRPKDAAF
ncbi:MAG: DNA topoisomerase III, partial [Candidatus Omnitrophica bacterium]|nr:DNA topoisomerase III [Candidatus Omnitrophota bacterium]